MSLFFFNCTFEINEMPFIYFMLMQMYPFVSTTRTFRLLQKCPMDPAMDPRSDAGQVAVIHLPSNITGHSFPNPPQRTVWIDSNPSMWLTADVRPENWTPCCREPVYRVSTVEAELRIRLPLARRCSSRTCQP